MDEYISGFREGNYTVTIQANTIGSEKQSFTINEKKLFQLFQLLKPEITRQSKKEDCSSIKLDQFFNGSVD